VEGHVYFKVRGERSFESSAPSLTIGTVSSCSIALRDPVASEEHCRIAWDQRAFLVEDLASATGTYLNGLAIEGRMPLAAGDVLVVGVTRLRVGALGPSSAPELELHVEEASFHYAQSGGGGAKRDPDAWVRWEVGFGRLPYLWLVGSIAALLGAALLASPWIRPAEQALLAAGPLMARHAMLFERGAEEIGGDPRRQHLERAYLLAEREGCAICHDAFNGTPMSKCSACHEDKVSGRRHPFGPAPIAAGRGSTAAWSEGDCVSCHAEHRGPERTNGPRLTGTTRETCSGCHSAEQLARAVDSLQERRRRTAGGTQPVASRRSPLPAPEFSHRAHLADTDLACDVCHAPSKGERSDEAGDYPPLEFESCRLCHDAHEERRAPEHAGFAARLERERLLFDVSVHGTDDGGRLCLTCHESVREASLRTIETVERDTEFRIARRSHGDLFATRGEDCTRCHLDGAPALAEEAASGPFRHGLHLAVLQPGDDPASQADASAECEECHSDQRSARALSRDREAQVRGTDRISDCATCHRDDDGAALALEIVPGGEKTTRRRADFPHDVHLRGAVPGGCFACHAFDTPSDLLETRPVTLPGVADCSACHARHANIGGGACARCHATPAEGRVAAVYRGETAWRSDWPASSSFRHDSRGHARARDEQGCRACHAGVEQSERAATIPIPAETDPVCVNCHMQELFHFPLGG